MPFAFVVLSVYCNWIIACAIVIAVLFVLYAFAWANAIYLAIAVYLSYLFYTPCQLCDVCPICAPVMLYVLLFVMLQRLPSHSLGVWVVGGYTTYDEKDWWSVVTSEDSYDPRLAGHCYVFPPRLSGIKSLYS